MVYDVARFAKDGAAFCRTYVLADGLFERFSALAKVDARPGDIILFHPKQFDIAPQIFPYKPSKARQNEALSGLREIILSYPRRKTVRFGGVVFQPNAHSLLIQSADDAVEENRQAERRHEEGITQIETRWAERSAAQERAYQELAEQLDRQKSYTERVEAEKANLQKKLEEQARRYEDKLHEEDEYIEFLERKLDRPAEHAKIADWVRKYFPGRLILHPKAVALLEDRSAQDVDLGLICDALDYLATDYWEQRYLRVSKEDAMARCSKKYGRPFSVKPTGTQTIQFTPAEYKIKYFLGAKGKPVESALDYHLGVGNAPENLLRIYFLHDDEKKLIIVGSLPRHLTAVTIK